MPRQPSVPVGVLRAIHHTADVPLKRRIEEALGWPVLVGRHLRKPAVDLLEMKRAQFHDLRPDRAPGRSVIGDYEVSIRLPGPKVKYYHMRGWDRSCWTRCHSFDKRWLSLTINNPIDEDFSLVFCNGPSTPVASPLNNRCALFRQFASYPWDGVREHSQVLVAVSPGHLRWENLSLFAKNTFQFFSSPGNP